VRSPREALDVILGRVEALDAPEEVPIGEAAGRVLLHDAVSDIDLPPFEKSAMDGYAVRTADFTPTPPGGEKTLPIVGESRAGKPLGQAVPPGACAAIYTGAEVPAGCDAVVKVEETRGGGEEVTFLELPRVGQNICNRGEDVALGARILTAGRRLRASDLSLLASVGCEPVTACRRPRVAVATTGDELVEPSVRPRGGQIREGSTLLLAAMVRSAGAEVGQRSIWPDDPAALECGMSGALEANDALVVTGGVSVGRYDLVGAALESLGVELVFHKVAMKPGKPLWFGMLDGKPVFGLPGNPVSSLVGCSVFVQPALRKMAGESDPEAGIVRTGRWAGDPLEAYWRERYLPVEAEWTAGGSVEVRAVPWNGSADVVGLTRASALAAIPAERPLAPGERVAWRELS